MSIVHPALNQGAPTITEEVETSWRLFLVQGIVMIGLGVLAIVWPQISTLAAELYVGWIFFCSGFVGLVTMFVSHRPSTFLWSLLTAALSLLVGVIMLWHPVEGAVTLTLVLVAFFIAEGVFQSAAAIRYRETLPETWGWLLMSGLTDLALAAMIILGWPANASWALGLIVGANLITSGLAITMVGAAGRQMVTMALKITR